LIMFSSSTLDRNFSTTTLLIALKIGRESYRYVI
jgi:hypothetical protein